MDIWYKHKISPKVRARILSPGKSRTYFRKMYTNDVDVIESMMITYYVIEYNDGRIQYYSKKGFHQNYE